jgi:DNA-binding HxlR family transcriptional regulator
MASGLRSRTAATSEPTCSIERTLRIFGDRWALLILREALIFGRSRFADFLEVLGIAPTVLTNRLETLVDAGVLEKRPYRDDGSRSRFSYHPTPSGEQLMTVLGALQQWGDDHIAPEGGPTSLRRTAGENRPVSVAFVNDEGRSVPPSEVVFVERPQAATRPPTA